MFPIVVIPFCFYAIGVVVGVEWPLRLSQFWLPLIPVTAIVLLLFSRRISLIHRLVGMCLLFVTGYVGIQLKFPPGLVIDGETSITASIEKQVKRANNRMEIILNHVAILNHTGPGPSYYRLAIQCGADRFSEYQVGEKIILSGLVLHALNDRRENQKQKSYWLSKGILLKGELGAQTRIAHLADTHTSLPQFFFRLRTGIIDKLDRNSHLGWQAKSLIKAMILGDKSGLSSDERLRFSRSGVAHMLAVSGLHVGVIYLMISWLLCIVVPLQQKRGVRILIIAGVWLYVGLTGLGPSACRAAIMLSIYEIIRLTQLRTSSLHVLITTAFFHAIIHPLILFQPGAQLSYLAVAGILLFMPLFQSGSIKFIIVKRLKQWFFLPIAAQLLILPIIILWFGEFPILFIAGNLLIAPMMLLLFYLGIAIILFCSFGLLASPLVLLANKLTKAIDLFSGILGRQLWAIWKPPHFGLLELILWYSLVLLMYSGLKKHSQKPWLKIPYIIFFYTFMRLIKHLYL